MIQIWYNVRVGNEHCVLRKHSIDCLQTNEVFSENIGRSPRTRDPEGIASSAVRRAECEAREGEIPKGSRVRQCEERKAKPAKKEVNTWKN